MLRIFCFPICGGWLFHCENCYAIAVFSQKMAACPQGCKKNCLQLCSDQKVSFDRKATKRVRNGKIIIFIESNIYLGYLRGYNCSYVLNVKYTYLTNPPNSPTHTQLSFSRQSFQFFSCVCCIFLQLKLSHIILTFKFCCSNLQLKFLAQIYNEYFSLKFTI